MKQLLSFFLISAIFACMSFANDVNNTSSTKTSCDEYTVIPDGLNIRETPNGKIIGVLKQNDIVCVIQKKDNWAKFEKGWLSLNHLERKEKLIDYIFEIIAIYIISLPLSFVIGAMGEKDDKRFKSGIKNEADFSVNGIIKGWHVTFVIIMILYFLSQ